MRRDQSWDDLRPTDRPMCSRFGSGTFPCGPAYKVLVTEVSNVRTGGHVSRRVMCRVHYETFDAKGGGSGIKTRAKQEAFAHLAAAHAEEFQALYETALRRVLAAELPSADPDLYLPTATNP